MYCRYCGAANENAETTCRQCGASLSGPPQVMESHVPNYLVQAILVTLFCCLPFGIVSIVFAAQVNARLAGGDLAGALSASNSARIWCWVSFICGLLPILLYAMFIVFAIASGELR
jgi:hypothetical protein